MKSAADANKVVKKEEKVIEEEVVVEKNKNKVSNIEKKIQSA